MICFYFGKAYLIIRKTIPTNSVKKVLQIREKPTNPVNPTNSENIYLRTRKTKAKFAYQLSKPVPTNSVNLYLPTR